MKWLGIACVGALALTGCGEAAKPEAGATATASNVPPAKSTMSEAIDGFTGKTAVDAGLRAKAKIQKIDAERRKDAAEAEKM